MKKELCTGQFSHEIERPFQALILVIIGLTRDKISLFVNFCGGSRVFCFVVVFVSVLLFLLFLSYMTENFNIRNLSFS